MVDAGGPEGRKSPWQEPSRSTEPPAPRPVPEERVPLTGARAWEAESNVARLVFFDGHAQAAAAVSGQEPGVGSIDNPDYWAARQAAIERRAASAVARGRIVARLREPGRNPSKVAIVENRDGTATVLFDTDGRVSVYTAPDATTATTAARAILASGSAFNW